MKIWGAPLGVVISFGSLIFASCTKSQDGGLKGSGAPTVITTDQEPNIWRAIPLGADISGVSLQILSTDRLQQLDASHKGIFAERLAPIEEGSQRYIVKDANGPIGRVFDLRTIDFASAYIKNNELLLDLRLSSGAVERGDGVSIHGCPDNFRIELASGKHIELKRSVQLQSPGLDACEQEIDVTLTAVLSDEEVAAALASMAEQIRLQWVERIGPVVPFAKISIAGSARAAFGVGSGGLNDLKTALLGPLGENNATRVVSLIRASTMSATPIAEAVIDRMSYFSVPVVATQWVPINFQSGERLRLVSPLNGQRGEWRGLKSKVVAGNRYVAHIRAVESFSQELPLPQSFSDLEQICLKPTIACGSVTYSCAGSKEGFLFTPSTSPWVFVGENRIGSRETVEVAPYPISSCTDVNPSVREMLSAILSREKIEVRGESHLKWAKCPTLCYVSCLEPVGFSAGNLDASSQQNCKKRQERWTFGARYSQVGARAWRSREQSVSQSLSHIVLTVEANAAGISAHCAVPIAQESPSSFSFFIDEKEKCIQEAGIRRGQTVRLLLANQFYDETRETCGTVTNIVTRVGSLPEQRTTVAQCLAPTGELLSTASSAEGPEVGPFKVSVKNATRIELNISDQGVYL